MRKQVFSWSEVTDQEIIAFINAVYKLRDEMLPVDCDGVPVIQLNFTDRRNYEHQFFNGIPYIHKDIYRHEQALVDNLASAAKKYSTFLEEKRRGYLDIYYDGQNNNTKS